MSQQAFPAFARNPVEPLSAGEATLRNDVRGAVVGRLGNPARGILVPVEAGFLKKGVRPAEAARQYPGTADRIESARTRVLLVYGSDKDRALTDRELHLPEDRTAGHEHRRTTGIGGAASCERCRSAAGRGAPGRYRTDALRRAARGPRSYRQSGPAARPAQAWPRSVPHRSAP